MPNLVIVVPGILGSELWLTSKGKATQQLWINRVDLPLFGLNRLELNAVGSDEADLHNLGRVEPLSVLSDYYGLLIQTLMRSWKVLSFAYDWRKDIRVSGQKLAQFIQVYGRGFDVYMVCHSMGGLVARVAHDILLSTPNAPKVKRIVTLGTPHWGSYGWIKLLGRHSPIYNQIVYAIYGARIAFPELLLLKAQVDKPICTWIGGYQLMPNLLGGGPPLDPFRPEIYKVANWATVQPTISNLHLQAMAQWHADIAPMTGSVEVMATIQGYGIETPAVLLGTKWDRADNYVNLDGDGTVSALLGTLPAKPVVRVPGEHSALPRHPVVLANVDDWLTNGVPDDKVFAGPVIY